MMRYYVIARHDSAEAISLGQRIAGLGKSGSVTIKVIPKPKRLHQANLLNPGGSYGQ
jgi:hypothetical protein